MELEELEAPVVAPKDCRDCKATCHLARDGCPYDQVLLLDRANNELPAMGARVVGYEEARSNLGRQAQACGQQIHDEIAAENQAVAQRNQQRMHNAYLALKGQIEAPRPPRQLIEEELTEEAPRPAFRPRDPDIKERLLKEYRQQADDDPDPIKLATLAPAMPTSQVEEYEATMVEPVMSEPPFTELLAVVAIPHSNNPDRCHVTVFYRGEPDPNTVPALVRNGVQGEE